MLKGAGEVGLKRFLASVEFSMGLTRRKVMEHVDVLVDLGYVELDVTKDTIIEISVEPVPDEPL